MDRFHSVLYRLGSISGPLLSPRRQYPSPVPAPSTVIVDQGMVPSNMPLDSFATLIDDEVVETCGGQGWIPNAGLLNTSCPDPDVLPERSHPSFSDAAAMPDQQLERPSGVSRPDSLGDFEDICWLGIPRSRVPALPDTRVPDLPKRPGLHPSLDMPRCPETQGGQHGQHVTVVVSGILGGRALIPFDESMKVRDLVRIVEVDFAVRWFVVKHKTRTLRSRNTLKACGLKPGDVLYGQGATFWELLATSFRFVGRLLVELPPLIIPILESTGPLGKQLLLSLCHLFPAHTFLPHLAVFAVAFSAVTLATLVTQLVNRADFQTFMDRMDRGLRV